MIDDGHDPGPVLRTERLELRPSAPEFIDTVWAAVQSSLAELKPWMHWAAEASRETTLEYLQHCEEQWATGDERNFTLFVGDSACGSCSLIRVDSMLQSAEIGYWMRSDLCGKNLMTEAAARVVTFGFEQESLHRIELHAGIDNHGSIRVAEKLGFRREGTLRDSGRGALGFHDSHVYNLLATDPRPDKPRGPSAANPI